MPTQTSPSPRTPRYNARLVATSHVTTKGRRIVGKPDSTLARSTTQPSPATQRLMGARPSGSFLHENRWDAVAGTWVAK